MYSALFRFDDAMYTILSTTCISINVFTYTEWVYHIKMQRLIITIFGQNIYTVSVSKYQLNSSCNVAKM